MSIFMKSLDQDILRYLKSYDSNLLRCCLRSWLGRSAVKRVLVRLAGRRLIGVVFAKSYKSGKKDENLENFLDLLGRDAREVNSIIR